MSSNLQKHICWFHPPPAHCRMVGCVHEAGCLPPSVGSKHHSSHIDGPSHRSHNDSHTWMDEVWEFCCSMMHIPSRNENTMMLSLFRTPCLRRKQTCWRLCREKEETKKLRALTVQGRSSGHDFHWLLAFHFPLPSKPLLGPIFFATMGRDSL